MEGQKKTKKEGMKAERNPKGSLQDEFGMAAYGNSVTT